MRNKSFVKLAKWISSVGIKGLGVFLVAGAAMWVYAADIDWPANPVNLTSQGVVGEFITLSASKYSTGAGYNGVNDYCENLVDHEGSHVCTPMEMINTYNFNTSVLPPSEYALVNNPTGGDGFANDCEGWSNLKGYVGNITTGSRDQMVFGSVWDFDEQRSIIMQCNHIKTKALPFACCK